ncbi:tetratricopeptide repeat protein [Salinibacterium sp. SYSU T00001]|uniref:tetratricopeptide repeat protein n=1 Tax=Homoserinimonas sedimenticola TaxID=2986805 RepID=UPI00223650AB|nr:tetratricopeptide repeat protein [Salinibacterium sedimenticola]MCW4384825.1 tetratricopeptide repeat protein [Salinibacterium sedimenticola]
MTDVPPSGAHLRGAVDLSSLVRPPAPAGQAPTAPQTGAGQQAGPSVPSLVVESGDSAFQGLLELSNTVPVVVEFHAGAPWQQLASVVRSFSGRLVLASVDATRNPQLQQAFNVAAVPTVAAVVGGRPLALFEGEVAEDQVRAVFEQLLALAAQNGVTGTVTAEDAEGAVEEPVEEPLPPLHQEAYEAIERGDYPAAIRAYETAIAQDPRDQLAVAGLAQVSLLHRLVGKTAAGIRTAAGDAPNDLDAQLDVADLDVSGGHLEDAFSRLLDLFLGLDQAGRDRVRTRLLEYFEIAGADDPRVVAARRQLTNLLY